MPAKPLLSPESLLERLDEPILRVIDCRFDLFAPRSGREAYTEAHIPGAVFLDLNEDLASPPVEGSGRHPLPDISELAATLGRLGISNASTLVVYDDGNGAMAARAWWILRWLGHADVMLLDGGWSAWQAAGLPQSAVQGDWPRVDFQAMPRDDLVVTTDEIHQALLDGKYLRLLDARDTRRFQGHHEPIDAVAGHIPGARNLPFTESLRENGHWKSEQELIGIWQEHLGADRNVDWIAMCGSGVTACHLAISAITAGYPEPRLYVGSWSEWITNKGRPIEPNRAQ